MKTSIVSVLTLFLMVAFISCSKDDVDVIPTPPPPSNKVPVIADQTFTTSEDINDVNIIGTVIASDEDQEDELVFSITQNSDDLFAISEAGELSLVSGSKLDYETVTSHTITITVSDGEDSASATIIIDVSNVNELPADAVAAFEFNQNYSDELQMNADLTTNGGITFTTDRFGNDNAIALDGLEGTKLTLVNTEHVNIGVDKESYSISIWYKTETPFSTFSSARLLEKWNALTSNSYPVSMIFLDAELGLYQFDKTANENAVTTANLSNAWTHIVMVYNGDTDELLAYKNGIMVDQTDVSNMGDIDNSFDFTIGNTISGIRPFAGALDDLHIYKRVLSIDEILALYAEVD